jgi:hypothetical protein
VTDEPVVDDHDGEIEINAWQFFDEPPTQDRVIELLRTLAPVHGVAAVDFADYVQALPQSVKITKRGQGGRKETETRDTWVLYMSVAGRIKMLQQAAEDNDWEVDFEPEPVTATGTPGLLYHGDGRIVYREYVRIGSRGGETVEPLGRKPGMAWVPFSGGTAAAGSNPYEKVETSARGRAIAAWGFGVLPGSGVASLEEMQGVRQNRAALEA